MQMAATEEAIVASEVPEEAVAPAENSPADENHAGKAKSKKSKEPKAKKVSSAPKKARNPPSHPPYIEMINEAITTLKERNGSSQYAIQKFIEEKQKQLPSNFRKLLLVNLRKFVASDRLVKVKGSYKLPSARNSAPKAAESASLAKKAKSPAVAKPKSKSKSKTITAKPKAKAKAVTAKPKAKVSGAKRKAVSDVKPAKVAKTTAKSTPSKKAPVKTKAGTKKAAPAKKAVAVKSVKSPVKRAMPKRRKK